MWVAGNSPEIQATFDSIVDSFNSTNESKGIKAKTQYVPWGELDQKLTTSLAGGVGPDVFMHGAAAAAGFATNGQIEPLDKYFEGWEDVSDFNEGYISAGAVNDEHYVVPIQGLTA
ncbi:extracellular solute-binding protein [Bacillus sp. N9]